MFRSVREVAVRAVRVIVALLMLVGVAACSSECDTASVEPQEVVAEIERLITDFNRAREANDTARIGELTTDDFTIADRAYLASGGALEKDYTKEGFLSNIDNFGRKWTLDLEGTPVITGVGPWFASVVEHWSNEALREDLDGISAYVFVGAPGELQIASKFWEGQQISG